MDACIFPRPQHRYCQLYNTSPPPFNQPGGGKARSFHSITDYPGQDGTQLYLSTMPRRLIMVAIFSNDVLHNTSSNKYHPKVAGSHHMVSHGITRAGGAYRSYKKAASLISHPHDSREKSSIRCTLKPLISRSPPRLPRAIVMLDKYLVQAPHCRLY